MVVRWIDKGVLRISDLDWADPKVFCIGRSASGQSGAIAAAQPGERGHAKKHSASIGVIPDCEESNESAEISRPPAAGGFTTLAGETATRTADVEPSRQDRNNQLGSSPLVAGNRYAASISARAAIPAESLSASAVNAIKPTGTAVGHNRS